MKLKTNSSAGDFDLWLGKAAPRYTSYPPAPFFNTGVNAHDYTRSLKGLDASAPLSLYIHIPFCRSLCLYCGCNALVTQRAERVQGYLAALKREIKMVAALTGKRKVNSLHFGGGTPNILGAEDLRDLFAYLREMFDFSATREIAMELDPRVVSEGQAALLAECGVNRISLGAQDFNPEVQKIVNRNQPYEMVARVCEQMRAAGINRINLDLMYGLPRQTTLSIAETAAQVCTLKPDRIALFSYAHVPQIKKHQAALEEFGLPDVEERLELDQAVRDVLVAQGYGELGIDHFARPDDPIMIAAREDRLHRSFQGYIEDATPTLIGLGCSSISQTPDGYFQNEHDERAYQSLVSSGKMSVRRGFLLSPEDKMRRALIEKLMCSLACDVEAICRDHDFPVENLTADFLRLRPFEQGGIVERDGYKIKLITPYRMAIRMVCRVFDPYTLNSQQVLYSRTA